MTEQEHTPITNQAEINVLLFNLKTVVNTRLSGINEIIRKLRRLTPRENTNFEYFKTNLALYKEARKKTTSILNKITLLLNKGIYTHEDFYKLKDSFVNLNIPNEAKERKDEFFES